MTERSDGQTDRDDEQPASDPALDAAWAALETGDISGARRRAKQLEEGSPDVLLLLAACAREEDDAKEAIGLLRKAAAADPDWATPELWLAELLAGEEGTIEKRSSTPVGRWIGLTRTT